MRPSTVRDALLEAARALTPHSETPRLDAELLLARAMGRTRAALLARLSDLLEDSGILRQFERMLRRRQAREPVAYILESADFYGLTFRVRPPVLIPRPESELLVSAALEYLEQFRPEQPRLLDLCTGSGCVLLAVKRHHRGCECVGVDISPAAVSLARENAKRLRLKVTLLTGNLFDPPQLRDFAPFHVIVANPPYVALEEWSGLAPDIRLYEDPGALLGGPDGTDILRQIVRAAPGWLTPGGMLAVEMGEDQHGAVREMAKAAGFTDIRLLPDLAGTLRALTARRP